jgi:hypothetical protein
MVTSNNRQLTEAALFEMIGRLYVSWQLATKEAERKAAEVESLRQTQAAMAKSEKQPKETEK